MRRLMLQMSQEVFAAELGVTFQQVQKYEKGVNRVSASRLQQAAYIHYSRGHIEITNLEGLSRTSCECYAHVRAQYTRLLQLRCPA